MFTNDNGQANLGPILYQDSISFHLSHQPPLKVTEVGGGEGVGGCNFLRWLMAQMKAYTILMNWTLICLTIVICRLEQFQPDVCCPLSIVLIIIIFVGKIFSIVNERLRTIKAGYPEVRCVEGNRHEVVVVRGRVGEVIEQFDAVACSGDGSGVVEDGVLSNVEYAPLKDRSYGFSSKTVRFEWQAKKRNNNPLDFEITMLTWIESTQLLSGSLFRVAR